MGHPSIDCHANYQKGNFSNLYLSISDKFQTFPELWTVEKNSKRTVNIQYKLIFFGGIWGMAMGRPFKGSFGHTKKNLNFFFNLSNSDGKNPEPLKKKKNQCEKSILKTF